MRITIDGVDYSFSFRGFGPQYTYELLAGEPFKYDALRSLHLLLYATLISCNRDTFALSFEAFTEWLYEHPAEEQAMTQAINDEAERRESLRVGKKKE